MSNFAFVLAVFILISFYITFYILYNIFFHPLASYPGPLLARSTLLWRIYHSTLGHFHLSIQHCHKHYGPVFRVSPNELSFSSATSFKDIYGHSTPSIPTFIKSEFYDMYGSAFHSLCIGSEREPKRHARMKKALAPAFSTKALRAQEGIIRKCVNGFVERLGKSGGSDKGLNMTKWFEMVAFDILGEMSFGEGFGCVESGKTSPWSDMIVEHLFFVTVLDNLSRFPFLAKLGKVVLPGLTTSVRDQHAALCREKVARRLASTTDRQDFLTNIVSQVKSGSMSQEEMTAHASTLVIAGGETVATFLAGTTYFLLKTTTAYKKLREEIRSTFSSSENITASSALQLPYLQAVISEGLRIYPPGSQGFPRISPGEYVDGNFVPKGTEVYTSAFSTSHDERNFDAPYAFKPERWIDPDCADNLRASQPFSLGPRGCLGQNFAYVEMSLILAKMHFLYDMELVDPCLDWLGNSHLHVMWWKPSLYVRFKRAQGRDQNP